MAGDENGKGVPRNRSSLGPLHICTRRRLYTHGLVSNVFSFPAANVTGRAAVGSTRQEFRGGVLLEGGNHGYLFRRPKLVHELHNGQGSVRGKGERCSKC